MKASYPGFLMKVFCIAFISCLYPKTSLTQCSSFVLATQQDVDQFPINFGCTVLTGQLLVNGSDITNLNALSALTQVQWLTIANTSLTNLSGLEALTTIDGGFDLHDNSLLVSTQGLQNLSSAGYIDIRLNPQLADISQLSKITTTGSPAVADGNLIIRDCPMLPSLNGLENITSVNGFLWIEHNTALQNLQALSKLTTVTKTMWINDNDALTDLSGLENLTSVNRLGVVDHASLINLLGLSGLTTIPGGLVIRNNASLLQLSGLENLSTVGVELSIQTNPLVSIQALQSLVAVGGNPDDNGPQGLLLDNLPQLADLHGLENLITISGNMLIDDVDIITDLSGLSNTKSINGSLSIRFNNELISLEGLNSLESIGRNLQISSNIKLTACAVDGICAYIRDNPGMATLGNSPMMGCNTEAQILANCSPLSGFVMIDANPAFLSGMPNSQSLISLSGEHLDHNFYIQMVYSTDFVTKVQSYWQDEFGWDNTIDTLHSGYEDVMQITNPIGWFPVASEFTDAHHGLESQGGAGENDIRNLHPSQLLLLDDARQGVAADGVSTILVRLQFEEKGKVQLNVQSPGFELPWSDTTYPSGDLHYAFVLFTPPDQFNSVEPGYRFANEVEAFDFMVPFQFIGSEETRSITKSIPIVRPPVILMHGTYSNPVKAWKTAVDGGTSMYDHLTNAGFKVFAVNYQESNGTTGLGSDISGFQDNAKVVWGDVYATNKDGIKDALTYYRDNLSVATTQADVVGHSLGGVLARVYASENYNPEYKRPENFMQGDINRLITIASTHFGSHLGELQIFLNGLSPFDIGAFDWIVLQAVNTITAWAGGASPSAAVMDQLPEPMGEALELIGRTPIPAHAITCNVPKGALIDPVHDPHEEHYDLFWYITMLMYQSDDIRDAYLQSKLDLVEMGLQASTTIEGGDPRELFPGYNNLMMYKTMIEDAIHRGGQVLSVMDGTFELPSEIDVFKYALAETSMSDFVDPLIDVFVAGADPIGVAVEYLLPELKFPTPQSVLLNYLKVHDESMEGLRALMFNNDKNDGVVRVQSQSGELEKECAGCVTNLENVLHSYAPRYASVQNRVLELLKSGMTDFHTLGFPPVDHSQKIYYPPASLDLFKVPKIGGAAICQSGMVSTHALAFAEVADAQNVIIITRPVNPDGTDLIARNAATKVMDVKPKSSNWGPQKGYLPVNQRYSKLWQIFEGSERDEKIAEYNVKAQENIDDGVAVPRHLRVEVCNGAYDVFIDMAKNTGPGDDSAEDEVYLVSVENPDKICGWTPNFSADMIITDCVSRGVQHQLVPLEVMATPDVLEDDGVTPRLLTADYDLLMVGFYAGEDQGPPTPPDVPFKPGVGQITPQQEALVEMLNEAVQNAGYEGGNVVHHGPENQFSKSPYIDYPLTVFAPDEIPNGFFSGSTGGKILSIEMGPPGYRDINLKHFVNQMRKEGYDLYHNPEASGWQWTWNATAEIFELEDSKDLNDYVEQLPANSCDKNGNQEKGICLPVIRPSTGGERPTFWPFGRGPNRGTRFGIEPNPVMDGYLNVTITCDHIETITLILLDALGNIRGSQQVSCAGGTEHIVMEISNLESGLYTIVQEGVGYGMRFVKM